MKNASKMTAMSLSVVWFLCFVGLVISKNNEFAENLMKTWKNNSFYAFRGIRYAEPPVGQLRFRVNDLSHQLFYDVNNKIRILSLRSEQKHGTTRL